MDDKLINAVYALPELYNGTLGSYRCKERKETAWKKVSQEVGVPEEVCRRRWKGLRDTYLRECRKEIIANKSGIAVRPRRRWKHTSSLHFLKPFIQQREHIGNMPQWVGEEENQFTESASLEDGQESSNGCAWPSSDVELDSELMEEDEKAEGLSPVDLLMMRTLQRLSEPTVKESSAELFCRSIVPHLEKLPLEKLLKVQTQILQVVQDAIDS